MAGPVTVAALALPPKFKLKSLKLKVKLRDSKKLSAKQRERFFEAAKKHPQIFYARANVYPKTIDRINISQAANLAATRALKKLLVNSKWQIVNRKSKINVFLDGGLYLNKIANYHLPVTSCRTVVRGDEKYNAIKLASIVAKVNRDRIISRNHCDYPIYGFAQHKGYGTRLHIKAIKKHGICELHRLTFIKNFV